MNNNRESFFVIESAPDGKGIPFFFDKDWEPGLPDYEFYNAPPCSSVFATKYRLKAKMLQLSGDCLVDENIVSLEMISLYKKLGVNFIGVPVDVFLHRGKKPEKNYLLFFLLNYLSILDEKESIYEISVDAETGKLNTPKDRGLKKFIMNP